MRRLSTIRAVLLTLAMVFQTVAGGSMAAHAAAMSDVGVAGAAGHCDHVDKGGKSPPADHARHGHDCLSCQLCADGHAFAPIAPAQQRLAIRDVSRASYRPVSADARPSSSALRRRARAPPAPIA